MADKDEVQIGDIVEVIVEKKVTGKSGESLKAQGHSNPNRKGQQAVVSGLKQVSKKDGKTLWTTPKDGKILIKFKEFQHPEGYTLPKQTQGKPPVLNDGEWKIVSKATPPAVPEDAERAREDDGTYKPDDKTTDDENEAYEPSSIETDEESKEEPSTQAPSQGFGDAGMGGFGDASLGGFGDTSLGGATTDETESQEPVAETTETEVEIKSGEGSYYCPKANSMKPMTTVFKVQDAGWTPIVNTREIDMEKLKEAQGSTTVVINEQGFKIRVLFSPQTNAYDDTEIDSEAKYKSMLKNKAGMIVREYEVGSTLLRSDIIGSGGKATRIGMNTKELTSEGGFVNKEFPANAQVTSLKLTLDDDSQIEEVMVSLLDRTGGDNQDYTVIHNVQGSEFSQGSNIGLSTFGGGGGTLIIDPSIDDYNRFYSAENPQLPVERFVMGIKADMDNAVFRDYWKPISVEWKNAQSIKTNIVDGKNIGGYVKIQLSCQDGDTTDLIPGRWEDFVQGESARQTWKKYPRNAVALMPHADDTTMKILSDGGETMGDIQEIQYHRIGDAIAQIRLVSTFERNVVDDEGNVVYDGDDDFAEPKRETVTLYRTLEKGQEVEFQVETRKGVGLQRTQTLKGEITLFTAYPKEDCSVAWDARKGQRFSFLSMGQQTITYLRHKSADDNIDRFYIIVANKPNEPHTGQVIVVDKSQPEAEEPASIEETIVPQEEGE
jgi:hypothetical protein